MIIPSTYAAVLGLLVLTMLCWGSWANTMRMAGKWRFELYYFDYTIGVLIGAVAICFTFGFLGDDVNFLDNIGIVRKFQMAIAMLAGGVFNLANMLLVAAIAVAGMSVAFPLSAGLGLAIGAVWAHVVKPQGNAAFVFGGAAVAVGAIIAAALAHKMLQAAKPAPPPMTGSRGRSGAAPVVPSAATGVVLGLLSGILMGVFYSLVQIARKDEIEMAPYPILLFVAIGVFVTTPFFSLYFLNLPVQGSPVKIKRYFDGAGKQHLLGILGGVVWSVGAAAAFVAPFAPDSARVSGPASLALSQGAALVAIFWGLLAWKEFSSAPGGARKCIAIAALLLAAGLALTGLSPLFA